MCMYNEWMHESALKYIVLRSKCSRRFSDLEITRKVTSHKGNMQRDSICISSATTNIAADHVVFQNTEERSDNVPEQNKGQPFLGFNSRFISRKFKVC